MVLPRDRKDRVPQHAILGKYADQFRGEFVKHVALLRQDEDLSFDQDAKVWHMGPPLLAGEQSLRKAGHAAPSVCKVHVAGHAGPLSDDQKEHLATFLAEVDAEDRDYSGLGVFRQYVVSPSVKEVRARENGMLLYRRFSCVGFVLACYRRIGIVLVNEDGPSLPDVDIDTLAAVYGDVVRNEGFRARYDLGIGGRGPWQILLPGYLLHALNRPAHEIRRGPYHPLGIHSARFPEEQEGFEGGAGI
jgi:hypothetical protein